MAKKRTDRKRAIDKCDTEFSRYIRARDNYTCFTCGYRGQERDGVMQCGHLITRAKYATRWDEENAVCQCKSCNMLHEYQPERFTDLWILHNGSDAYHELVLRSNTPRKFSDAEIREMADGFKKLKEAM